MCQAKRILALLLSVVLLVQIVPTSAFAKPSTNLPEAETGASVGIGEDPIPRDTELYATKPIFLTKKGVYNNPTNILAKSANILVRRFFLICEIFIILAILF